MEAAQARLLSQAQARKAAASEHLREKRNELAQNNELRETAGIELYRLQQALSSLQTQADEASFACAAARDARSSAEASLHHASDSHRAQAQATQAAQGEARVLLLTRLFRL